MSSSKTLLAGVEGRGPAPEKGFPGSKSNPGTEDLISLAMPLYWAEENWVPETRFVDVQTNGSQRCLSKNGGRQRPHSWLQRCPMGTTFISWCHHRVSRKLCWIDIPAFIKQPGVGFRTAVGGQSQKSSPRSLVGNH